MSIEDSLALSDVFIQKCELLNNIEDIINLQYCMVYQFTKEVSKLNIGSSNSKIIKDVASYIRNHIYRNITVDEIASSLYISRPYLSRKFKNETGMNISDYIFKCKIEEAKSLLAYSTKSITAISEYLSFSSPGHFTRTFRKFTGMTPLSYRSSHIH